MLKSKKKFLFIILGAIGAAIIILYLMKIYMPNSDIPKGDKNTVNSTKPAERNDGIATKTAKTTEKLSQSVKSGSSNSSRGIEDNKAIPDSNTASQGTKKVSSKKVASTSAPEDNANTVRQKGAPMARSGKKAIGITTHNVKAADFKIYERAIGVVYNFDSLGVAAEVSGIISGITVEIGDYLKKNQILGNIAKEELINTRRSQAAEVETLEAKLKDQQRTAGRYKELFGNGFISQAELDASDILIKSYEGQLASAKALLSNSNIEIEKSTVRAKSPGFVQQRYVTNGVFVGVGTLLFDIVDNTRLTIIVNLPEGYASILKRGQKVVLRPSGTEIMINHTIKEIKPVIEAQSRSVQAIIEIDNNRYNLKPGGTLDVQILIEEKSKAILVPEASVVLRTSGKVVYVVNSDNTVSEKKVKVGVTQEGFVEIVLGLNVGELIAVDGAGFLTDKAIITLANR